LRDLSRYWHEKKEARNLAKAKIQDGYFNNGNPKYKVMFKCAICLGLFDIKETRMDHIDPVISIEDGWVDWNTYISRLFTSKENYQCLCSQCHDSKSFLENELRREFKKKKIGTL
jgi:5-methylcytosine-specific restriction endonuclease McrA